MAKSLIRPLLVAFGLLATTAFAQNTPLHPPIAVAEENPSLDGNYVVTLSSADKKGPDISVLVATQRFSVTNSDANVNLSAQLFPQEKGGYLLRYDLVQGNPVPILGQTTTRSAVFLRTGEPVQIIKNGAQFFNLRLDRYNPPAPAKGGE